MKEKVQYIAKRIDQKPVIHTLWREGDDGKGVMAASALVTVDGKNALLWIIEVRDDVRNKGFGSTLVREMQQTYDFIETQWISLLGKKLMLSCGFNYPPGEPNGKTLIWCKP